MSEVDVVRLVFAWHQHQSHPVNELHPIEGVDPHIHKDTIQHRHGNELEDWSKLDRQSSQKEDTDTSHSLLSEIFIR